ncbi:uncharacterized, partial [Tachysurus ichikawai]
ASDDEPDEELEKKDETEKVVVKNKKSGSKASKVKGSAV